MNDPLTGAVRECLLSSIRAADPRGLVARSLGDWDADGGALHVIAVGKAAVTMVQGATDALGNDLAGVAIGPEVWPSRPARFLTFAGGHPTPNAEGAEGAQAILRMLSRVERHGRVLVLISGGASSLMTLPAGDLTIHDVIGTTRALMASGADIRELNCVRKHLDRLKGGLLARATNGAVVRGLVLSDVIGDPLDVIASGLLVPDPTTYDDAIGVLRSRSVWDSLPPAVRAHLLAGARGEGPETPKQGDPCFANTQVEVIGNNALAVAGAAAEARRRGFDVEVLGAPIDGEARDAGPRFAGLALERRDHQSGDRPLCLAGGGETTVTVTGTGLGGRNLEFALAAALAIEGAEGVAVGSIGTDGRDGPTDAAGAVVDGSSGARAKSAGVDLAAHLRNNDALAALDKIGAVIRTGPTGTNVMDVQVAALRPG